LQGIEAKNNGSDVTVDKPVRGGTKTSIFQAYKYMYRDASQGNALVVGQFQGFWRILAFTA
jgi:hypothetical protein